jgi:transcriptional regulator with XRE-family HTH domain
MRASQKYMSLEQVAELFGVSAGTARDWANRKYFATFRPNARVILAVRSSVEKFESAKFVAANGGNSHD